LGIVFAWFVTIPLYLPRTSWDIPDSNNQNANSGQKVVKTGLANADNVEITEGVTEGEIVRLPQLAISNSNTNAKMQNGFGGFGGMGGTGGMNRQFRNGNNGGGNSQAGGSSSNGRGGN